MGECFELIAKPMLVSVAPHPDECLMSIVLRTTEANVLGRMNRMLSLAGITGIRTPYLPFTGEAHIHPLAVQMSMSVEAVQARMHLPVLRPGHLHEYVNWYGTPVARRSLATCERRVSPEGVRRSAYHRAIWMVRGLPYCPETLEFLISECQACGSPLTWEWARCITTCETCGSSLADQEAACLPRHLHGEARTLAGLLNPDERCRDRVRRNLPEAFRTWEPGDIFQAIVELAIVVAEPVARSGCTRWKRLNRGDVSDLTPAELIEGYRFVCDWPLSLGTLLKEMMPGRTGAKRNFWGRLGKYFDPTAPATPLRDLIREEVPRILPELGLPLRSNQIAALGGSRERDTISAGEAGERFGVDKSVITRLSDSPACFVAKHPGRSGISLYRARAVEHALQRWRATVSENECARALGVPAHCISALSDAELLPRVQDHEVYLLTGRREAFLKTDLNSLRAALQGIPSSPTDNSSVPLYRAMIGELHPDAWALVIRALLSEELPVRGRVGQDSSPLAQIYVDLAEAEPIILRARSRPLPDISISSLAAAKLLGVSNAATAGAVMVGLLPGERSASQHSLWLSDLQEFHNDYILAQEVLRRFGIRPQEFSGAMRHRGYLPVAQAYNSYFWRRREAERVLSRL